MVSLQEKKALLLRHKIPNCTKKIFSAHIHKIYGREAAQDPHPKIVFTMNLSLHLDNWSFLPLDKDATEMYCTHLFVALQS